MSSDHIFHFHFQQIENVANFIRNQSNTFKKVRRNFSDGIERYTAVNGGQFENLITDFIGTV